MSRESDDRAEFFVLLGALLAVALPGLLILFAMDIRHQMDWYGQAARPGFAVSFVVAAFGWAGAYLAMAYAIWLTWRETGWPAFARSGALWLATLILCQAWSYLMLFAHRPGWAIPVAALMCIAVAACVVTFRRFSDLAAVLMLIVLAWTGYAGLVTFAMWRLNQ